MEFLFSRNMALIIGPLDSPINRDQLVGFHSDR
jgi:hypothetical protein